MSVERLSYPSLRVITRSVCLRCIQRLLSKGSHSSAINPFHVSQHPSPLHLPTLTHRTPHSLPRNPASLGLCIPSPFMPLSIAGLRGGFLYRSASFSLSLPLSLSSPSPRPCPFSGVLTLLFGLFRLIADVDVGVRLWSLIVIVDALSSFCEGG